MIAPMVKFQIAAPRARQEDVLQFLQEEEVLHITNDNGTRQASTSQTALQLANVQFALEFVTAIRKRLSLVPKRNLKNLFVSKPAASLPELVQALDKMDLETFVQAAKNYNDTLNQMDANSKILQDRMGQLSPWEKLSLRGRDMKVTSPVMHVPLLITTHNEPFIHEQIARIPTAMWQEIHREELNRGIKIYGELIFHQQDIPSAQALLGEPGIEQVQFSLSDDETITGMLASLQAQYNGTQLAIRQTLDQAKSLCAKEQDLKFAYDALLHQHNREEASRFLAEMPHSFVLAGWVPKKILQTLSQKIEKKFPDSALTVADPGKDDRPPVALTNSRLLEPFEAVTNVYGKPAYNELDPSPALSFFFLIAFGLALTDAGYGLVMMATMAAAEKFFRLKREMRKMTRLLFYAGAATVVLGALTGGWFGLTLEELPPSVLRDALLSLKLIDPISNPIGLLFVAFALGIIQLITAWGVRGYYHWTTGNKKEVFLDDIPWITIVPLILAWVASNRGILPASAEIPFKWLMIANLGILVITQGRSVKNPFLKLGTGTLSLYGLVGFLSDTLSYSRLLALGLATGIIGLVVNLIASMVSTGIPVVGAVLAVGVLLVGHVFNLGINALGAFIHSSRLQFVEFFPKFMEGGGVPYRPFGRSGRYVDNPRDFI